MAGIPSGGTAGRWLTMLLAPVALGLSACASGMTFAIPAASPYAQESLTNQQAALRYYTVLGDSAGLLGAAGAEGDSLLRLLDYGLAYHRLGQYQASNTALQAADRLAEERYTISISQNIAAFIVNDKTIDFTPAAHERAMIHFYGMLNYLALGDQENALVEARAASEFLRRYQRENGRRTYTGDGAIEYLAALLHWGAGDENDALVALRHADADYAVYREYYGVPAPWFVGADLANLSEKMGLPAVARDARAAYGLTPDQLSVPPGSGRLLVLVENGFIAHRVEQKVYIPILPDEKEAISGGDADRAIAAGMIVTERTVSLMTSQEAAGQDYAAPYLDGVLLAVAAAGGDIISMAWPSYALEATGVTSASVVVDGGPVQPVPVIEDLSAIAARGFEEDKPKILGRMIPRALLKYGLVQLGKKEAAKKGEGAGFLAGLFGNAIATATEHADLRSWSFLPAEIRAVRLRLPAGIHRVVVRATDTDGSERTIDLGTITISAGGTVVRSVFVTGSDPGAHSRLAAAATHVDFRAASDTSGVSDQADTFALPPSRLGVTTGAAAPAQSGADRAQVESLRRKLGRYTEAESYDSVVAVTDRITAIDPADIRVVQTTIRALIHGKARYDAVNRFGQLVVANGDSAQRRNVALLLLNAGAPLLRTKADTAGMLFTTSLTAIDPADSLAPTAHYMNGLAQYLTVTQMDSATLATRNCDGVLRESDLLTVARTELAAGKRSTVAQVAQQAATFARSVEEYEPHVNSMMSVFKCQPTPAPPPPGTPVTPPGPSMVKGEAVRGADAPPVEHRREWLDTRGAPITARRSSDRERHGMWGGLGLGYGSWNCNGCGNMSGLSGNLRLGGTLNPNLLLGAGTFGFYHSESSSGTTVAFTIGGLAGLADFYPSATGGLFFQAGLGYGQSTVDMSGFGSASFNGFMDVLGLGYDVKAGNTLYLTPNLNYFQVHTDGETDNVIQIGLAASWH